MSVETIRGISHLRNEIGTCLNIYFTSGSKLKKSTYLPVGENSLFPTRIINESVIAATKPPRRAASAVYARFIPSNSLDGHCCIFEQFTFSERHRTPTLYFCYIRNISVSFLIVCI